MLALSPQVFAITARLIEEGTGLRYELAEADLLADRLSQRASELGLPSLLDYYYFLRYDPGGEAELSVLAELLVVHETYFFRELDGLRVLVEWIVPGLLKKQERIRIWSAACATGEEPYSLAMLLSEAALLDRVEIVASDISERALAKARVGKYSGRSLRAIHEHTWSARLLEERCGVRCVRDDLRQRVALGQLTANEGFQVRRGHDPVNRRAQPRRLESPPRALHFSCPVL